MTSPVNWIAGCNYFFSTLNSESKALRPNGFIYEEEIIGAD
ncbi:hypothetical protein LT20_03698 [Pseudomonas aeruginosa]|nr:hypothetical protein AI22_17750 [Pseudomonas aeruginosa YL84]ETV06997.1 hypothetical protein Q051_00774 [Pseudomonas aeruginosa BWHPSA046]EZO17209.1 hypothetical protein AJ63_04698 [Pseudomonas aeruginosa 3576]EZP00208.1 hypothetical protein V553_02505 [Pseudomonas aeruginosa BWH052]KYO96558.1 hypothetical protein LT20_03698 [Pseudomonas aeruginosa]